MPRHHPSAKVSSGRQPLALFSVSASDRQTCSRLWCVPIISCVTADQQWAMLLLLGLCCACCWVALHVHTEESLSARPTTHRRPATAFLLLLLLAWLPSTDARSLPSPGGAGCGCGERPEGAADARPGPGRRARRPWGLPGSVKWLDLRSGTRIRTRHGPFDSGGCCHRHL